MQALFQKKAVAANRFANTYDPIMMNHIAQLPPSWGKRLLALFWWSLLAVVFGVIGWHFGVNWLAISVGNGATARDYQSVEASVLARTECDAGDQ